MKILMIIILLGICSTGSGKKEKPAARQTETSSFQMPAPGLIVQI
ncbi:MAG: hypothetical protein ACXWB9_11220 [Flavisolibacter sp.]